MNLRERMSAHVAELEAEHGATVEYREAGAAPESEARLWMPQRRIVARPIRTRRQYYVILHEFGHIAQTPLGIPLYDEAVAWLWALHNTRFPPTPTVLSDIDRYMTGYVCFRGGFKTFGNARDSLPKALRNTWDALYTEMQAYR